MYKKQLKCTKAPKQVSQECINSRFFFNEAVFSDAKKNIARDAGLDKPTSL